MTQKNTNTAQSAMYQFLSVPENGQEMYDAIMGTVNPALTSTNIPATKILFATCTAEEAKQLATQYQADFEKVGAIMQQAANLHEKRMQELNTHIFNFFEEVSNEDDALRLERINKQTLNA